MEDELILEIAQRFAAYEDAVDLEDVIEHWEGYRVDQVREWRNQARLHMIAFAVLSRGGVREGKAE